MKRYQCHNSNYQYTHHMTRIEQACKDLYVNIVDFWHDEIDSLQLNIHEKNVFV